jgi:predicted DNA-binding WGR domain protein
MMFMTRTDPARNMRRFCKVHIVPKLFGEWTVMREWGRLGRPGTLRTWTLPGEDEAEKVRARSISRKLRRGYTPVKETMLRWKYAVSA